MEPLKFETLSIEQTIKSICALKTGDRNWDAKIAQLLGYHVEWNADGEDFYARRQIKHLTVYKRVPFYTDDASEIKPLIPASWNLKLTELPDKIKGELKGRLNYKETRIIMLEAVHPILLIIALYLSWVQVQSEYNEKNPLRRKVA